MRKRSEVAVPPTLLPLGPATDSTGRLPPVPREEPAGIQFVKHAGAEGTGPTLSQDFEQIVARVFNLPDALSQYDRLEKALTLGDQRTDLGALTKALDEAEDNARMAHKLYANAKIEEVTFEKEWEVARAPLVGAAGAALQEEKDRGGRNKQITDGDVNARAAEMFPAAYRDQHVRAAKIKYMVEHTKKLSELWTQRCSSLQTLLSNRRK